MSTQKSGSVQGVLVKCVSNVCALKACRLCTHAHDCVSILATHSRKSSAQHVMSKDRLGDSYGFMSSNGRPRDHQCKGMLDRELNSDQAEWVVRTAHTSWHTA